MAELGIIASVVQIADVGLRLSIKLYTFGEIVASADRSVISISKDVSLTSGVLKELGQILDSDRETRTFSENAVQTADGIVKECLGVFQEMESMLVKKLPGLAQTDSGNGKSGQRANKATVMLERLKWGYLQPKLQLLRSNLDRLKSTLLLMLNVITYARQVSGKYVLIPCRVILQWHGGLTVDRAESPSVIAEQRSLIEVLSHSNQEYIRKFETLKIGIEETGGAHKENEPKENFPTTRSSPRTLRNTARSGQMSGLANPTKLLSNAKGNTNIDNLIINTNVRNISPPPFQKERDMLGLETTTVLDQKVLMKQLEHYSMLIVNLLKEVDEAQYDIALKSRLRVKGGIAGLRDMEMQELEGILGRAAVQRAEQSFVSRGEVLGELPRMNRFVARDPVKTLSPSGVRHAEGEIRHHSRAKRETAVTSPQSTHFDVSATEDHFKGPVSVDDAAVSTDEAAVKESSYLDLSDTDSFDGMPGMYLRDDPTSASRYSGSNWDAGPKPVGEGMEDGEEEEEEEVEAPIVSSTPKSGILVRKNAKGFALGAAPRQSIDGLGLGTAAVAAAVGYANRNAKKNEVSGRRSRSRTRRDSVGALPAPEKADNARIASHRNDQIPQAGLSGAAVAGLVERARSKSRGGGKRDRSKSRIRQGLPITATSLGSAAIAGLYEKQQAGKEEEEAPWEECAARSLARSSTSNGQKPMQPRQEKDYFLDPRSAPPTPKTSSLESTELWPLSLPRPHSDASAADTGTRPPPRRLTQVEIWNRRRMQELEQQGFRPYFPYQQLQGPDPRITQLPPQGGHFQPGHHGAGPEYDGHGNHGGRPQLRQHSYHSDEDIVRIEDDDYDSHDGHDDPRQKGPRYILVEPAKIQLPKGYKAHAKKKSRSHKKKHVTSRSHKKKHATSLYSSEHSSISDDSSGFTQGYRARPRSLSRRPVPRGRSRSHFTDDSFEDLVDSHYRSRSRADLRITAQYAYPERPRPLRTHSPQRRATEDDYAIRSRARVSIEAPEFRRFTSILAPASGVVTTSSAQSTGPIIINAAENSSRPVTSKRRDRRDDDHEILPSSSSTRRRSQRYSSLGVIPTGKDSREKPRFLSAPPIRERQDENGRDYAEFRHSSYWPRGYISAPVTDYQGGSLPESESVVGPQNSSSPVPQSEVDGFESSVSANETYVERKAKKVVSSRVWRKKQRQALPPSAPSEDERDDPPRQRLKKLSAFTHGESDSGTSMGADMEVVDRLVLLWTTVKPQ